MVSSKWRTIAIDPTRRGFAFAVLEGSDGLLDWGAVRVPRSRRGQGFVERLELLIERYSPRLLVVEDCRDTRRGRRACRWIGWFSFIFRGRNRGVVAPGFGDRRS